MKTLDKVLLAFAGILFIVVIVSNPITWGVGWGATAFIGSIALILTVFYRNRNLVAED
jgi:hypothetical protein